MDASFIGFFGAYGFRAICCKSLKDNTLVNLFLSVRNIQVVLVAEKFVEPTTKKDVSISVAASVRGACIENEDPLIQSLGLQSLHIFVKQMLLDPFSSSCPFYLTFASTEAYVDDGHETPKPWALRECLLQIIERKHSSQPFSMFQGYLIQKFPSYLVLSLMSFLCIRNQETLRWIYWALIVNMNPELGVTLMLVNLFYNHIFSSRHRDIDFHDMVCLLVFRVLYATATCLIFTTWEISDLVFANLQVFIGNEDSLIQSSGLQNLLPIFVKQMLLDVMPDVSSQSLGLPISLSWKWIGISIYTFLVEMQVGSLAPLGRQVSAFLICDLFRFDVFLAVVIALNQILVFEAQGCFMIHDDGTLHVSTVISALRCLSYASRLPKLDWGAVIRRMLDLKLQSCLLLHLADLIKIFSVSRLEKLLNNAANFLSWLVSSEQYNVEEKSLLGASSWKGLYACLDGDSLDTHQHLSNMDNCMKNGSSGMVIRSSAGIGSLSFQFSSYLSAGVANLIAFDLELKSNLLNCLRLTLLICRTTSEMNFMEVNGQFFEVVKKIKAKARLVQIGSVPLIIWNDLVEVVATLQQAEERVKRLWLLDTLQMCDKLSFHYTVLSDLPVTLASLFLDVIFGDIAESAVLSLWTLTMWIYDRALSISKGDNLPTQQSIDRSENDLAVFLLEAITVKNLSHRSVCALTGFICRFYGSRDGVDFEVTPPFVTHVSQDRLVIVFQPYDGIDLVFFFFFRNPIKESEYLVAIEIDLHKKLLKFYSSTRIAKIEDVVKSDVMI
ncbi:hypothetical protein ACH5RR_024561 [Cinchona calisaya]|uniref:Uncharacterized protein n=1 Tax=Cinchona calisaya TaxID=153742 RepID=A0ABD2YX20_9GENT